MSDKLSTILLVSGGLSSFIAQSYLGNVPTLHFKTDNKKEFNAVNKLLPATIIDDSFSEYKSVLDKIFSPNCNFAMYRELFFAFFATQYADTIYLVEVQGETILTPQILKTFSKFLSELNRRKIVVLSPFWHLSKVEVVEWYFSNGFGIVEQKVKWLLDTTSCCDTNNTDSYCGVCHGCFDKWLVLYMNGVELKFSDKDLLLKIYEKAQSKLLLLDNKKRKSIITAISRYLNL